MTKELLRRGFDTDLYAITSPITDDDHVQEVYRSLGRPVTIARFGKAFATALLFLLKRRFRRYDVELRNVTGENPDLGLRVASKVPYYHGIELIWGYVKPEKGFVSSPDLLLHAAPGSVLLPRCVNLQLFQKPAAKNFRTKKRIRIGHFWRRGGLNADFAFRYFKGTDLLEQALQILRQRGVDIDYVNQLTPRNQLPNVLRSLDVLADQFVVGAYGLPAVEALLLGVPVVGYYRKELCECAAVYGQVTKVERKPESIAEGILSASEQRDKIDTREIEDFHSPKHNVDILLETLRLWGKI